ncbi:hypothetical protein DXG03_005548, partial [Asterophora parasitica]
HKRGPPLSPSSQEQDALLLARLLRRGHQFPRRMSMSSSMGPRVPARLSACSSRRAVASTPPSPSSRTSLAKPRTRPLDSALLSMMATCTTPPLRRRCPPAWCIQFSSGQPEKAVA